MTWNYDWSVGRLTPAQEAVAAVSDLPATHAVHCLISALRGPDSPQWGARELKEITVEVARYWLGRRGMGKTSSPSEAKRRWASFTPSQREDAVACWNHPDFAHFRAHVRQAFEVLGSCSLQRRRYIEWVEQVLEDPREEETS